MIKLLTPLVLTTTLVVTVLAAVHLYVLPESLSKSLLAMLFLPTALGFLTWRSRGHQTQTGKATVSAKLRAALVGGGMLIGAALIESIGTAQGLLEENGDGLGSNIVIMLCAIMGVAVDLISARLEHKADKEQD